ncbi:hypothetical protein EHQ27_15675 [Leptospira wolffii]|uniref:hypothetical protein n=1 Tax=Leptospira wolffii TaxID=409998 RepID=UPI001083BD45|nr:hypothetical protein [Leptospira wolffii]TGK67493.1 hypothetical protein EHQ27_15675 [Leptospira wolffii]
MGRTLEPYSREIDYLWKDRFQDFRRALPRIHQEAFDEIFRNAKRQLAAGVMASNPYSIETILLSEAVNIKTEVNSLKKAVADLQRIIKQYEQNL